VRAALSLLHGRFHHDAPFLPDVAASLRMIRRIMTLCFCAIAFWAGMKLQQARSVDACLDAGGAMRGDVLCTGVSP
jgi:hypothetical protein